MANTYIKRTCDGAYTSTFTWSAWVKRSATGSYHGLFCNKKNDSNSNSRVRFYFSDADRLAMEVKDSTSNDDSFFQTNRLFRDVNAWYHIVLAYDTTESAENDRIKLWVNNEEITSWEQFNRAGSGFGTLWSSAMEHRIGTQNDNSNNQYYFNGSMSHIHFTYGTAYTPSAFGETDANGVWKIKTSPSVTYGSQGYFVLKDGNSLTDQSGEGNNFTVGGGTLTKTEDCPSNVFCTINALAKNQYMNLYNGNTSSETNNGAEWSCALSTLGMNGGKYYCEAKIKNNVNQATLGIYLASLDGGSQSALDSQRVVLNTGSTSGNIFVQGLWSYSSQSVSPNASNGDIYGIAFDSDNGSVQFYRNGSTYGSAVSNSVLQNETFMFGCQQLNTNFDWNFGNGYFGTTAVASAGTNASGIGIFEYDVPTGYTALSTKGLNL